MLKRTLSLSVIVCFFLTTLGPLPQAQADSVLGLPAPGTMVNLSPAYEPVIIKGLTVHKDNPFLFDFIVDVGQDKMSGEPLKKEGEKLIKYFLASLAIPDKDAWVNLSPYERSRIIPEALGQTDMGRDLLEQDYILKQITASLIYPEKQLGKTFWEKVYSKAQKMYGTTQIPVNTFNKVWIMADKAEVFEHNQTAFVVRQHLKVMLEEDYLALQKHSNGVIARSKATKQSFEKIAALPTVARNDTHGIASNIVREIILPQLEHEVNTGKNFANLRQIFNSVILASWYKKNLKQALLNQVYANQSKVKGIERPGVSVIASEAKQSLQDISPDQIYEQYLKAYKKGVFNYIKEDITAAGTTIPRKYFSGGTLASAPDLAVITNLVQGEDLIQKQEEAGQDHGMIVFTTLADSNQPASTSAAMTIREVKPEDAWGGSYFSVLKANLSDDSRQVYLTIYPRGQCVLEIKDRDEALVKVYLGDDQQQAESFLKDNNVITVINQSIARLRRTQDPGHEASVTAFVEALASIADGGQKTRDAVRRFDQELDDAGTLIELGGLARREKIYRDFIKAVTAYGESQQGYITLEEQIRAYLRDAYAKRAGQESSGASAAMVTDLPSTALNVAEMVFQTAQGEDAKIKAAKVLYALGNRDKIVVELVQHSVVAPARGGLIARIGSVITGQQTVHTNGSVHLHKASTIFATVRGQSVVDISAFTLKGNHIGILPLQNPLPPPWHELSSSLPMKEFVQLRLAFENWSAGDTDIQFSTERPTASKAMTTNTITQSNSNGESKVVLTSGGVGAFIDILLQYDLKPEYGFKVKSEEVTGQGIAVTVTQTETRRIPFFHALFINNVYGRLKSELGKFGYSLTKPEMSPRNYVIRFNVVDAAMGLTAQKDQVLLSRNAQIFAGSFRAFVEVKKNGYGREYIMTDAGLMRQRAIIWAERSKGHWDYLWSILREILGTTGDELAFARQAAVMLLRFYAVRDEVLENWKEVSSDLLNRVTDVEERPFVRIDAIITLASIDPGYALPYLINTLCDESLDYTQRGILISYIKAHSLQLRINDRDWYTITTDLDNIYLSPESSIEKKRAAKFALNRFDLAQSATGGIDLNTSRGTEWKDSKDGKGVEMNVDLAQMARIEREGIKWLSPRILSMTPVESIWPLVGLQAPATVSSAR